MTLFITTSKMLLSNKPKKRCVIPIYKKNLVISLREIREHLNKWTNISLMDWKTQYC